jgi:hypothetical protein
LLKKELSNKNSAKKNPTYEKSNFGKHPIIRSYEKHNLACKLFLFNKETQVEIFFKSVFRNQSVIAGGSIFDMIAASLSNILI